MGSERGDEATSPPVPPASMPLPPGSGRVAAPSGDTRAAEATRSSLEGAVHPAPADAPNPGAAGAAAPLVGPPPLGDDPGRASAERPTPAGGAERARPRRWVIVVTTAALVCWTVAAVVAGLSIGAGRRVEPPAAPPDVEVNLQTVEIPDAPETEPTDDAVVTPNVLGLTPTEAQAALSDAGVTDAIELAEVGTAGDSGFVVDQNPAPGVEPAGPVKLSVSAVVDVPQVVGTPYREATGLLESLGAQARVLTVYQEGVPADQVISITPDAGPLPLEVELLVSAPPAELDLSALAPIEETCFLSSDFGVAGEPQQDDTWVCTLVRIGSFQSISWDLSRDVERLRLSAGLTDESDPAANAVVDVLLDGQLIESQQTAFGSPTSFDLYSSGALRVEVRVRTTVDEALSAEWDRSWVAVYDVIAVGSAASLDELAGLNS